MSTPSKKRRVIAYQSKYGSDVINIYKCGDCQGFFPSLQTIHTHFESCAKKLNPPACQNQFPLEECPAKTVKASDQNISLTEYTSKNGTITNSISSNGTQQHLEGTKDASSKVIESVNSSNIDHRQLEDVSVEVSATSVDSSKGFVFESGDTFNELTVKSNNLNRNDSQIGSSGEIKTELFDLAGGKANELASDSINISNRNHQVELDTLCETKTESFDSSKEICHLLGDTSNGFVSESLIISNGSQFQLEGTPTETTKQSNRNQFQTVKASREIEFESINALNRNVGRPSDETTVAGFNSSCGNQNDQEETSKSVDILVDKQVESEETSDTFTNINKTECKLFGNHYIAGTGIIGELKCGTVSEEDDADIEEINVSSGPFSASYDANCRLTSKNSDIRFSCTTPIDTLVGLSGNRKRKFCDEQSCNASISAPVPITVTTVNTNCSENYRTVDTKRNDSIYVECVIEDSNEEENEAKFTPFEQDLHVSFNYQISDNNSLTSDLPCRQSNIENMNKNQTGEVGCLDEKDEKLADIYDEPQYQSTKKFSKNIENTNNYVTDQVKVTPLENNRNISNCNGNDSKINNAGIDYTGSEVPDPSNSILHIKCEETGNCVVSVDISSTNTEKKVVSNSELMSDEKMEDLVLEGCIETFSEKVSQGLGINIDQQLMRCQTKECISENKSANKNDTVRPNQSRVLITYNEKENTDLNLECEDNVICVENNMLPSAVDISDEQRTLEDRTMIEFVEMDNHLELRKRESNLNARDKDVTNTFQYKLKHLSVTLERLDIPSAMKWITEESPNINENESGLRENTGQLNNCMGSEEQNEPCKGISQTVIADKEAVVQSISNDHGSNRYKCHDAETRSSSLNEKEPSRYTRENTFCEDNKSDGHLSIKINNEVETKPVRCIEEIRDDESGPDNGFVSEDLLEGNAAAEDSVLNKNCKYCEKCNTHFTELSCYINHLILYHHPAYTRTDLTWCPFCTSRSYSSYYNSQLNRHISFVHKLDEMKCLRCELRFDTYCKLHKHVNVCKARFPRRLHTQPLFYSKRVQCGKCKAFHVYKPSSNSGDILKDIVRTLPNDKEVNVLKGKNEKLQGSTAKVVPDDGLQCKACKLVFKHLTCALNHAIIAHMKDTLKTKCSLFHKKISKGVCGLCNKGHAIVFLPVRKMRDLLLTCGNRKSASEQLNSIDKKSLAMIRDGLVKYYCYKNPEEVLYIGHDNHFCKECNNHVGPFVCGLNHMIVTHFSRANIDIAVKSCFLNRRMKSKKCLKPCNNRHFFIVPDIRRLKYCLAYESEDNTDHMNEPLKEGQLSLTSFESSIIKKLREILVIDKALKKSKLEYNLKIDVNVVAAKTKEEISRDMEYRVAYVNGNFICRLCHSQYSQYSCCKSHVLTEHTVLYNYRKGSEVYTCPECMMNFYSLHQLDVHLEQLHSIYKFTCIKCDARFSTYSAYCSHVKHGKSFIQTNFNEKLSCQKCRLLHNCTVQNGEEELITSLSSDNEIIFKNVRTDRTMHVDESRPSSEIADHSEQNKDSYSDVAFDGQQFVCLVCLKQFKELRCCFTHVVMLHYQKADLICNICQKTSRQKFAHISHLKDKHGLEAHYCRHCYTGFECIVLRDNHAEHCKTRTNKVPENVDENLCRKCYSVHTHLQEGNADSSCDECELGFSSIGCAKNHFYHKHFPSWVILASSKNVFRCPCGKEVLKRSELTLHIKNNHGSKKDKIDQGKTLPPENQEKLENIDYDSYFRTKEDLDNKCVGCEHVHIIASNTGRVKKRKATTSCKVCQKTFSSPNCLQNHVLADHSSKFQPRQCVGCGLHFAGSRTLKRHQNEYLTLNDGQENEMVVDKACRRNVAIVKCDECKEIHQHQFSLEEKQLKTAKSPKAIKDERHRKVDYHRKVHKCCTCSLVFTNWKDLMAHRRSIHGKIKDEKGVICQVCNKETDKNMFYSEHLKQVHCSFAFVQGEFLDDFERNFSCVYCEKNFSFVMDVQMHLRSKHFGKQLAARKHYRPELEGILTKGLRILQCPVCLKLENGSVRCHIDQHFNDILGKEKSKETVCDICGKGFRFKCTLVEHKASHAGTRKYKCPICEKSFIYLVNLQTHSLVHGEKKEKCSICGMKFTLPHHVRAHIKRKHPDHT